MNFPGIWRKGFAVALIAVFTAGIASADTIPPSFKGEINFAGINGTATPTGGTGLGDATGVAFNNSMPIFVMGTNGDFDAVPLFTIATFFNFTFAPSAPAHPLWQIVLSDNVYQFAVDRFSVIHQNSQSLSIRGRGNLMATGFRPTPGTWIFNLNRAGQTNFGWSASAVVPEPGTLALLGLGLVGIGAMRRRRTG